MNDFLPSIVSIGLSLCVFLYAWLDIRSIQRLHAAEPPHTETLAEIETIDLDQLSFEQLSTSHDIS
jgi:hypothetical protein